MPCTDWSDYSPKVSVETLERVEAMLCGVMRALENAATSGYFEDLNSILMYYDARSAGVPKRELLKWWAEHKKKDLTRGSR